MSTIYLAGPMRGYDKYNFPAFAEATALLREQGHTVVSPAEMDQDDEMIFDDDHVFTKEELWSVIHRDLKVIADFDQIAFLPGWAASSGARLEFALGCYLSLTFRRSDGIPVSRGDLEEELAENLAAQWNK